MQFKNISNETVSFRHVKVGERPPVFDYIKPGAVIELDGKDIDEAKKPDYHLVALSAVPDEPKAEQAKIGDTQVETKKLEEPKKEGKLFSRKK